MLGRKLLQRFFSNREHAARAARAVIEQVSTRLDFVGNGQEDQLRHEFHGVARRPVFTRLFIVLFVKAADQLFEDRPHRMVIKARVLHRAIVVLDRIGTEVDVRREELID